MVIDRWPISAGAMVSLPETTQSIKFRKWFSRARIRASSDLAEERKRYRGEIAAKEKAVYAGETETIVEPRVPDVDTKAYVTLKEPYHLVSRRTRVGPIQRSEEGDDSMTYKDGCTIRGKAGDDRIRFEPHYVDMQLVPSISPESVQRVVKHPVTHTCTISPVILNAEREPMTGSHALVEPGPEHVVAENGLKNR